MCIFCVLILDIKFSISLRRLHSSPVLPSFAEVELNVSPKFHQWINLTVFAHTFCIYRNVAVTVAVAVFILVDLLFWQIAVVFVTSLATKCTLTLYIFFLSLYFFLQFRMLVFVLRWAHLTFSFCHHYFNANFDEKSVETRNRKQKKTKKTPCERKKKIIVKIKLKINEE